MNDATPEQLSPVGAARRDEMLDELLSAVARNRRRRRTRRQVIAAFAILIVLPAILRSILLSSTDPQHERHLAEDAPGSTTELHDVHDLPQPSTPDTPPNEGKTAPPLESPMHRTVIVAIVHTDPNILERYRPSPRNRVQWMDDGTLLATLDSIGRPAGLIQIGSDLRLSNPVTDAELRLRQ